MDIHIYDNRLIFSRPDEDDYRIFDLKKNQFVEEKLDAVPDAKQK